MGRRKQPPTVQLRLRVPPALKAHLEDLATQHGRSLNEEANVQLTQRKRKWGKPLPPEVWDGLMALEPLARDPSVSTAEIVRRMEEIHPAKQLVPERRRPTQPPIPPRTMDPLQP